MTRTRQKKQPLRVMMFTMLTEKNASSRVVVYQFREPLEHMGFRVTICPPSSVGLYERFQEFAPNTSLSCRRLLTAFYWYALVLPRRLWDILRAARYDVVLVQRMLFRYSSPPVLERLLSWLNSRVIYNYDDAIHLRMPRKMARRIQMAAWVYTGNEDLARFAEQHNSKVTIIESVVDTEYYRIKGPRHADEPVVIGWIGNPRNLEHLALLEPALTRLASRRQDFIFKVICSKPWQPGNSVIPVEFEHWQLDREVEHLLGFDIGVMPLIDSAYARGKEGYKIKQYMATGLPVVCSPVGKNRALVQPQVTGYWATNDEEWEFSMERLIDSIALRRKMGAAGREFIEDHYSRSVAARKLAALIQQVSTLGCRKN